MKHLLPAPILSLVLLISWLMLNGSASAGNLLLGAALALVIPWFSTRFSPERSRVRRWGLIVRLAATVLLDIVKSNIDVARRVLGPESAIQPRFLWVPVSLQDPNAIVLLAAIITTTPGTISAELSEDRGHLLVHALHCPDDETERQIVADIQARYQAPLQEIFG